MITETGGTWSLALASDEIAAYRPATVRQLIDIQLDRIEAPEQRVLEVASLIGPQFVTSLVAQALEATVEHVDDICESLARRALFITGEEDEEWPNGQTHSRYGVTHALVQEVCFDRCPPARRSRWHRLIAQQLDAAYGDRTPRSRTCSRRTTSRARSSRAHSTTTWSLGSVRRAGSRTR